MPHRLGRFALLGLFLLGLISGCCAKRWDVLSKEERATLQRILNHWETWMSEEKKKGTAPLLTFEKLYRGLDAEEQKFLDRVRTTDPQRDFGFQGKYLGTGQGGIRFKRLKGQKIFKKGKRESLDPQYLPENVYKAYKQMMKAMKKDLGKILLVESGFRSPAYQLYTFLYYTPKHHYSLVETGHWVALPGYSEHGAPHRQAIDFINEEGINGEDNVEDFERLPEYDWLLKNAYRFGFELSYPRGKKGIIPPPAVLPRSGNLGSSRGAFGATAGGGITFEPWHWRYSGKLPRVL